MARTLALLLLLSAALPAQTVIGKVVEDELPPLRKRGDPLVYATFAARSYDGKTAVPLILAIHAGRGSARQFCTFLQSLAEAQGAVIACPQGIEEIVGADGYWWKGNKAEMAAIDRLLAHIRKTFKIDEKRISLVGLADGAELGLKWALSKDRGLQGVIALNFLWKSGGLRAPKGLKICLIASKDATEKRARLADHASRAHKTLSNAKYPTVLRIVPGASRSFFHGWGKLFRKTYQWFDGKLDWPAEIAAEAAAGAAKGE